MASWWDGVANVQGNGRHWRHSCCRPANSQCWSPSLKDATRHAQERAEWLGIEQDVRWSERRKVWVIESKPKVEAGNG